MKAPDPILALANERAQAKLNRDFARADLLRDQISAAGWIVTDGQDGFTLVQKPPFHMWSSVADLPQHATPAGVSVGLIVDGWWSDAQECLERLIEHSDAFIYVLDVTADTEVGSAMETWAGARTDRVQVFHIAQDPGWGQAARKLVEISAAPLHVLLDPSTRLTGAAFGPMQAALADPSVVAVGWKGALVALEDNWRSVEDRGPGEVDVLLGYLMMVRREALLATGYPHPKARFYRNADLELSLGLRAAGGRLVAMDLPVEQARHHGYHDSEPEMRERESKRTYDRILQTFRGREEILAPRRP